MADVFATIIVTAAEAKSARDAAAYFHGGSVSSPSFVFA